MFSFIPPCADWCVCTTSPLDCTPQRAEGTTSFTSASFTLVFSMSPINTCGCSKTNTKCYWLIPSPALFLRKFYSPPASSSSKASGICTYIVKNKVHGGVCICASKLLPCLLLKRWEIFSARQQDFLLAEIFISSQCLGTHLESKKTSISTKLASWGYSSSLFFFSLSWKMKKSYPFSLHHITYLK